MSKDKKLDEIYLFQLEKAYKQFKKYKKDRFKALGIDLTSDQWIVLKRLSEQEGINQKELAEVSFKEPASVTRILDILERKEWIERKESPDDRRIYHLHLTEEGKELVERLLPVAREIRAQGVKGISETEVRHLTDMLSQMFENFH